MQELGKFNFKINVIRNGLKQYMRFATNNKLSFIDCFQFLSSSLADVFEEFRNNNFKNYGFCPSHYLTAAGLSWETMLKMEKIELEIIPDPDMHIFFEKGTREIIFIFLIDTVKPTINI